MWASTTCRDVTTPVRIDLASSTADAVVTEICAEVEVASLHLAMICNRVSKFGQLGWKMHRIGSGMLVG